MLHGPGLGDLLDLPPLAQGELRRRPPLYFGYRELNPSALKLRITSRTRSSLVNATFAIAAASMPWADSSTICARRQVTTDPLPRRTIRTQALVVIDLTHPHTFGHRPSLEDQHRKQKRRPGSGSGRGAGDSVADVTDAAAGASWRDMELGAPELARLGVARLATAHVALLGTLRRDGSPRISPIEPYLAEGQLLIGAMTWTGKASDLRRDPRYVLHSAVTSPDSGRRGSSSSTGQRWRPARPCGLPQARAHGGWPARRTRRSYSACASGRQCSSTGTSKHGQMTIHRWSPANGYAVASRPYP